MTAANGDPDALERAARELNQVAQDLKRVAAAIGAYSTKIEPISSVLSSLVGGSATGNDARIGGYVSSAAKEIKQSSASAKHAADQAKRAAIKAAADAGALRRQQQAAAPGRR